jgi:hypothetical protein
MNNEIKITDNKALSRFETEIDGEFAYLEYHLHSGSITLIHTFTPPIARGMGISSALARFGLSYAERHNLKVIVYCPFVTSYLKKHPEYESRLDIQYRIKQ